MTDGGSRAETQHVMPRDDLIEHSTDDECLCGATPLFETGGVVYVHHSLDNREAKEQYK